MPIDPVISHRETCCLPLLPGPLWCCDRVDRRLCRETYAEFLWRTGDSAPCVYPIVDTFEPAAAQTPYGTYLQLVNAADRRTAENIRLTAVLPAAQLAHIPTDMRTDARSADLPRLGQVSPVSPVEVVQKVQVAYKVSRFMGLGVAIDLMG